MTADFIQFIVIFLGGYLSSFILFQVILRPRSEPECPGRVFAKGYSAGIDAVFGGFKKQQPPQNHITLEYRELELSHLAYMEWIEKHGKKEV